MDRKSQNLQSKHRYVYGGSPDHLPLPVEDSCGDLHDNTQNHSLPSRQRLSPQHFRPHQSSPSASEGTTAVTLIRPQYLLPQHWHSICASPRESDIRLCSRVGGKKGLLAGTGLHIGRGSSHSWVCQCSKEFVLRGTHHLEVGK